MILWLFACLKHWILLGWLLHSQVSFLGLSLLGIAEIFELTIQFYFFAILIEVIIRWIQPTTYNPFITILYQLTEPLLVPARRMIPAVGGLDLLLLVLLALQLVNIMIVAPFTLFAMRLTVGMIGIP